MAESAREVFEKAVAAVKNEKLSSMECAVCLQTCVHPAELPCGHIFCYLCIKGIVNQGRRCAMCRRDIPVDYLDKPRLLNPVDAEISNQGFEDGHLWFYEGHNGWWQYDERTSLELESAYQKGERCCELLIAGFLYVADFDEMLQYRRNDPSRRRRIKRDLATTSKKGVAGLKTTKFTTTNLSNTGTRAANETTCSRSSSASMTTNSTTLGSDAATISSIPTEPIRSGDRILLGLTHPTCNTPTQNASSNVNNSTAHSRNFNFDSVIHETLDWTIEQIESLNLELLNDYEVLFRDVNNYRQLRGNLNQNRSDRVGDNYMSRYFNRTNPWRESPNEEAETTDRISQLSEFSESSPEDLPVPAPNMASEIDLNNSVEVIDSDTPPQPPPRVTSRRRNLRRSVSLNHEMSKFSDV